MILENESRAKLYSNKPVCHSINTSAPLLVRAGSGSALRDMQSFLFKQVLYALGWVVYENVTPQDFQDPGRKKNTFGKLNISDSGMINFFLFRKMRD